MSAPAENAASPAPVITTTRTSSRSDTARAVLRSSFQPS